MLDTMTFTKVLGSFCGALLIFLLGKWAAEEIYAMGGGHGDDHGPAYVIDLGEDDAAPVEEEEGPSFAELYASADMADGEKVFGKCKACHVVEQGVNKTGPYLHAIVGREVGVSSGFNYSGALNEVVAVWTPEELDGFLENPKSYAPGTSMAFSGLKKLEDRVNLIAYLDNTDGTMTELAVPAAAEEEAAAPETVVEEVVEEAAAEKSAAEEAAAEEPAIEEETAVEEAATEEPAAEEIAAAEEAPTEEAVEVVTEEPAAEVTADAAAGGSAFATLVATADIDAGKKAYRQCAACHVADKEQNRVGPHLVGIVDRDVANVDGFGYSDVLLGLGGQWDIDRLSGWLENPREFAPGNRMSFRGVSDEEDRANLIGYLQSLGQ